jgi:hypothetical protein
VRLRSRVPRRPSTIQSERPRCRSVWLHALARSVNNRSFAAWTVAAGTVLCAVIASTAVAGGTASTTFLKEAGQSSTTTVRTHPLGLLDAASFEGPDQALALGNARPLRTGFLDPTAFSGPNADRSVLRARRAGATLVRLLLAWKAVAPDSPADPEDPEDPAYQWQSIDQQVVDAVRGGLDPLVYISASVPWARGAAVGLPGTWPSPARFADFARAAARRYSGTFVPTGATVALPRVRLWQVWNEPNAGRELAPQRVKGRPVSAAQYRRMVNAFADAVHGVDTSNLVVAGGLAPFGHDSKDIQVVAPLQFMSTLLCVSLQAPHRKTCSQRTRFDVWAHHPYSNGGPNWHARGANDASIGDLPDVRALLTAAERAGTITSARAPKFWVTEFSWDTRPPDPRGVPSTLHARWVAEALYRMWQAGVSAVIWFRLQDDLVRVSPYQSGFFTASGRAKHSLEAFRFPFVAFRTRSVVTVWGRTPSGGSGSVIVERQSGKHWISIARLRAARDGIFSRPLLAQAATVLRARLDDSAETSIPFSLTVPQDRSATPFGCGGPIPCRGRRSK